MQQIKKSLGLLDATFLVAGSMIGSGIFIVSSEMSRDLGSSAWLLFTWLLTGIITLFGALSYGELAAMFPKAGGQFVYIKEAWGKMPSFLYGWTSFLVIQTGLIAAVGVAFGKFTGVFFPILVEKNIISYGSISVNGANLVGAFTIILLTYLNIKGIQYGKIVQAIFTSSKLLALLILIIAGIFIGINSENISINFTDMWNASKTHINSNGDIDWIETLTPITLLIVLSTTIINSLFSSDAWNNVTFIAGDIRNPEKNLPRALILGTILVTLLYILANFSYLCLLPLKGMPISEAIINSKETVKSAGIQFASKDRVGTAAAYMLFGNTANFMMAALIMISTFGCNNGLIMAGSRLFYAMSNEGLFIKKANKLNKNGIPYYAMTFQGIWAVLLCLSGSYSILIKFATFGSMVFYIVTILAIFKLRKTKPDINRPYKVLAYPYIPIAYIIFAVIICTSLIMFKFEESIWSIFLILSGFPVYYIFFKAKNSN